MITAASLVGLVLIAFIATWAFRKRRNDRIHQDILDFSNAGLVGTHDTEKGGNFGDDTSSTTGHGSGSSGGHAAVPPSVLARQQMYQDNSSVYTAQTSYPQPPPSRNANPYGANPYGQQAAYAYPQRSNTYDNWAYYQNPSGPASSGSPMPNPYDQAYGVADAYGGIAESLPQASVMAGVGAGAQRPAQAGVQRRPSAQRKPAPHLSISSDAPPAAANLTSPESTTSLNNPPLQPAADLSGAVPAQGRLVVSRSLPRQVAVLRSARRSQILPSHHPGAQRVKLAKA